MDNPQSQRRKLSQEEIEHESEIIFKEIQTMYRKDYDLSMKCPLEWLIMEERNLSAQQTIECFRLIEQRHKEELVSMKYGIFSHFGGQIKPQTPPPFKYRKYIPQSKIED